MSKCVDCKCGEYTEAREIVESLGASRENAIPLLQEIQRRKGYLPESFVEEVADASGIPFSDLFGVATFYAQFRFSPQGKKVIKICKGTACHVSGADMLAETVSTLLGIGEGETTEDRLFTLESVACLGCCSLAPVVMIDEKIYGKVTPKELRKTLETIRSEETGEE